MEEKHKNETVSWVMSRKSDFDESYNVENPPVKVSNIVHTPSKSSDLIFNDNANGGTTMSASELSPLLLSRQSREGLHAKSADEELLESIGCEHI